MLGNRNQALVQHPYGPTCCTGSAAAFAPEELQASARVEEICRFTGRAAGELFGEATLRCSRNSLQALCPGHAPKLGAWTELVQAGHRGSQHRSRQSGICGGTFLGNAHETFRCRQHGTRACQLHGKHLGLGQSVGGSGEILRKKTREALQRKTRSCALKPPASLSSQVESK